MKTLISALSIAFLLGGCMVYPVQPARAVYYAPVSNMAPPYPQVPNPQAQQTAPVPPVVVYVQPVPVMQYESDPCYACGFAAGIVSGVIIDRVFFRGGGGGGGGGHSHSHGYRR